MGGFLGLLLLLPLVGAFGFVVLIVRACVKGGGLWRLLGVLVSLAIGGACVLVGYWVGIEGFRELVGLAYRQVTYPVWGWFLMIGGGLIALIGTWSALFGVRS